MPTVTELFRNGFIITDASDVERMMQPHPDVADGELCEVPITKRGERLNAEENGTLRRWAAENVRYGVFVMTLPTAKALLGLEPIDPKQEAPFCKLGDTYYAARNNSHNRRLVEARLGGQTKPGYAHDMQAGLWGFADPLIVHADGIIGSAQHRATAYIRASEANPELGPIEFPILLYVPPQFGDFLDRGKQRDPKDTEYRDATNFTDELVDSTLTEIDRVDLPKLREKWAKTLVTASVNVFARTKGVNVHPSKTQSPSSRERLAVQERFDDPDDLQRLILRTWESSRTPEDKPASWSKVWSEALVVTALVLRSNADHDDPSKLTVDWDYVDRFLPALRESAAENGTGPFGPALQNVVQAKVEIKKSGGSAPSQQELFAALVAAIGQFDDGGETSKVWPTRKDRKKAAKDKSYPIFGGVDSGAVVEEK